MATMTWDPTQKTLNLAAVDENAGNEPLPAGEYEVVCEEAEFGDSSKGNPMITFKFKVDDEEASEEANGRVLYYHVTLNTTFGIQNLKKVVLALAPDADMENFEYEECDDVFSGRRGRVKVNVKRWEGVPRNNVKAVLPSREAGFFNN